jgi:hypothetical protein
VQSTYSTSDSPLPWSSSSSSWSSLLLLAHGKDSIVVSALSAVPMLCVLRERKDAYQVKKKKKTQKRVEQEGLGGAVREDRLSANTSGSIIRLTKERRDRIWSGQRFGLLTTTSTTTTTTTTHSH